MSSMLDIKVEIKSCIVRTGTSLTKVIIITYFLIISSPEFFARTTDPQVTAIQRFHKQGGSLSHQ